MDHEYGLNLTSGELRQVQVALLILHHFYRLSGVRPPVDLHTIDPKLDVVLERAHVDQEHEG